MPRTFLPEQEQPTRRGVLPPLNTARQYRRTDTSSACPRCYRLKTITRP